MPDESVALATSKRKFDRLLDNLSHSPTPSSSSLRDRYLSNNTSSTNLTAPLGKRPRMSAEPDARADENQSPASRPRTPLTDTAPVNSIRHVPLRRGDSARISKSGPAPKTSANYNKWKREAFLARLETFRDPRVWTRKPARLGEVEWAKMGWTADQKDWNVVVCKGGCEARQYVRIYPKRKDGQGDTIDHTEDLSSEPSPELIEKYADLTTTGHREGCLWRARGGCLPDIYRIPMTSPGWKQSLLSRYTSLMAIHSQLPTTISTKHLPSASEVRQALSQDLLRSFQASTKASDQSNGGASVSINDKALLLALTGWTGYHELSTGCLQCFDCFARIAVWLYTDAKVSDQAAKQEIEPEELYLKPVDQHYVYCPWRNPKSHMGIGNHEGLAGWANLWSLIQEDRDRERERGVPESSEPLSRPSTSHGAQSPPSSSASPRSKEDIAKDDKKRESRLSSVMKTFKAHVKPRPSKK